MTISEAFILSHETYVVTADSEIRGFYALHNSDLIHMWVDPARLRQGIGRFMFAHAIDRARSLGFQAIQIESDPNAEAFYRRLGAIRCGQVVRQILGESRTLPLLHYELTPQTQRSPLNDHLPTNHWRRHSGAV